MRRQLAAILAGGALVLSIGSATALAGQPSVSCDDFQPGPPGFSTDGFANAELHYANPGSQGGISSGNVHVVSQYDVACYHFSLSHS
jgi:hypothetical protein